MCQRLSRVRVRVRLLFLSFLRGVESVSVCSFRARNVYAIWLETLSTLFISRESQWTSLDASLDFFHWRSIWAKNSDSSLRLSLIEYSFRNSMTLSIFRRHEDDPRRLDVNRSKEIGDVQDFSLTISLSFEEVNKSIRRTYPIRWWSLIHISSLERRIHLIYVEILISSIIIAHVRLRRHLLEKLLISSNQDISFRVDIQMSSMESELVQSMMTSVWNRSLSFFGIYTSVQEKERGQYQRYVWTLRRPIDLDNPNVLRRSLSLTSSSILCVLPWFFHLDLSVLSDIKLSWKITSVTSIWKSS